MIVLVQDSNSISSIVEVEVKAFIDNQQHNNELTTDIINKIIADISTVQDDDVCESTYVNLDQQNTNTDVVQDNNLISSSCVQWHMVDLLVSTIILKENIDVIIKEEKEPVVINRSLEEITTIYEDEF